ncbi:sigma-70 family RNA polymerase sigma factor [Umezawaea endophytica]|uniref:Sigma-70 family RNA polymerase sigma factor n=1 Tax=Umezawaea endophytica TaxID=1654476 RepID=A0A9X3AH71_9PSEU|nr:sigma-70 family RNA polymerase sigma factor [Umezawaea endophytica]MCS7481067.1 sigma-70 family RNA polymerase sigma factor [Umezawaea endophytica]
MNGNTALAARFEADRPRLRAVAHRMLGSTSEADDAVQEAWLRLDRSDTSEVGNLSGWLTTVVARVCLDVLRSRKSRREEPLPTEDPAGGVDPEHEALLADSVGVALLVVLDTLAPAERLAFVLHDLFGVSFVEIAPILGKSPAAARQLASRARRRVRGTESAPDPHRGRVVVDAFLAASREGDFAALLTLLDPDAVVRSDAAAAAAGSDAEVRGRDAVAAFFNGRAKHARSAFVDGLAGAAWAPGGTPRVVFDFVVSDGLVVAIDVLADPDLLAGLDLELVD